MLVKADDGTGQGITGQIGNAWGRGKIQIDQAVEVGQAAA